MISFLGKIELRPNDRIIYRTTAIKNGTKTEIKKRGLFVRKIKHTRHRLVLPHQKQMAAVYFVGNTYESRVEYNKLEKELNKEEL